MQTAECFSDIFDSSSPYTVIDEGLRVIRVRDIVGTVDKCGELDTNFQYIRRFDKNERFRRRQIEQKTEMQFFFSPIEVNRYKKQYYIIDGHRRTAAAKLNRIEFIDAYVTTYIPEKDRKTRLGLNARKQFEQESGITTIFLSDERNYKELLDDLKDYSSDKITKEHALQWKTNHFLPACRIIEKSYLRKIYPDLESGDIYALMHHFYSDYFGGFPAEAGFQSLVSTYCSARCPAKRNPFRRLFRMLPFRLIYKLFTRKGSNKMI